MSVALTYATPVGRCWAVGALDGLIAGMAAGYRTSAADIASRAAVHPGWHVRRRERAEERFAWKVGTARSLVRSDDARPGTASLDGMPDTPALEIDELQLERHVLRPLPGMAVPAGRGVRRVVRTAEVRTVQGVAGAAGLGSSQWRAGLQFPNIAARPR